MSDYPKGLRFDIYERLTLSDDVAGIGELEDIELVPRITMQTHNDQAVLSGDLLLTGTYVGVEERSGVRQLSHRIPVEITLPLKRIKRMDSIGIEIDNFDVELISARSLNITGVISLNGIDTAAEQSWKQQGEALFVHEAESSNDQGPYDTAEREAASAVDDKELNVTPAAEAVQEAEQKFAADNDAVEPVQQDAVAEAIEASDVAEPTVNIRPLEQSAATSGELRATDQLAQTEQTEQTGQSADVSLSRAADAPANSATSEDTERIAVQQSEEPDSEAGPEADRVEPVTPTNEQPEAKEAPAPEPEPEQPDNAAVEALEAEETKDKQESKEMKIAFGSNKQDSEVWTGTAAGVKSLLSKQPEDQQDTGSKAEQEAADKAEPEPRSVEESVKWKNLLLSAEQEELRFSKMRMCIVQKEETLDTIASRYSLNPKEIVLYNRLETEQVHEGQVIYIPG